MYAYYCDSLVIIVALKVHGVAAQDAVEMRLFDHLRTPIDQEVFPIVVEQFHRDASFYVEIEFDNQVSKISIDVSYIVVS